MFSGQFSERARGGAETKTCRVTAEAEAAGLSNAFHQMSCNTAFLRSLTMESQLLHPLGTGSLPQVTFLPADFVWKGQQRFLFSKKSLTASYVLPDIWSRFNWNRLWFQNFIGLNKQKKRKLRSMFLATDLLWVNLPQWRLNQDMAVDVMEIERYR